MSSLRALRLSPASIPDWLLVAILVALAGVVVICPIFDYDMYWHLAYGREMWETGRILQHEPFSYTAAGTPFSNRAWLAQWILFVVQDHFGWYALLGLKLLVTATVAVLMFRTALFLGASRWVATLSVLLGILAGHYRYTERPELFSLLLIALLFFILAGWHSGKLGERSLWAIPPLMLVWDWLHGGVFGFALLCAVVGMEYFLFRFMPGLAAPQGPKKLSIVFIATLIVMAINPLGLAVYLEFFHHLQGLGNPTVVKNMEYLPINWREFKAYIFTLTCFLAWLALAWRAVPVSLALAAFAFALLGVQINRVTGVAMIIVAPLLAAHITHGLRSSDWKRRFAQASIAFLVLVFVLDGWTHKFYAVSSPRAFGWKLDDQFFPAGAARFVKEMDIQGNLFNTGHLGGYLAWELYPERRVFHYNNGATFGDTYRFWGRPDLLERYDIQYAFIAHEAEFELFPNHGWARVYRDPGAALVVRRSPENAELIRLFELRHFHPMMTPQQLNMRALSPAALPRLLDEMAVYLAFRLDNRIAAEFKRFAAQHPQALAQMKMGHYLARAAERHATLAALAVTRPS